MDAETAKRDGRLSSLQAQPLGVRTVARERYESLQSLRSRHKTDEIYEAGYGDGYVDGYDDGRFNTLKALERDLESWAEPVDPSDWYMNAVHEILDLVREYLDGEKTER